MIEIEEVEDFTEVVNMIKASLPQDTKIMLLKIRKWHDEKCHISFKYTDNDNLYECLNNIIQCSDCKNGCQYDEESHEFLIHGSLYYPPKKDYAIQDYISITFRVE